VPDEPVDGYPGALPVDEESGGFPVVPTAPGRVTVQLEAPPAVTGVVTLDAESGAVRLDSRTVRVAGFLVAGPGPVCVVVRRAIGPALIPGAVPADDAPLFGPPRDPGAREAR
jgi:hypothetical protein